MHRLLRENKLFRAKKEQILPGILEYISTMTAAFYARSSGDQMVKTVAQIGEITQSSLRLILYIKAKHILMSYTIAGLTVKDSGHI